MKTYTEPEGIAKNKEILENLQESHSVQIGAILKRFIDRLEEFKVEIKGFNRDMNKRQISNIKRLEFFVDENNKVLNTVRKLEQVDTLFGDPNSSKMIERLTDLVEGGDSISLPNLFNLGIRVELENGKKIESYGQTKIESNGTDLTVLYPLSLFAQYVINISSFFANPPSKVNY